MDEIGGDPGAHGLFRWLELGDRFLAQAGEKFPLLARLQSHTALSSRSLLLGFAGLLLLLLLLPLLTRLLNRPRPHHTLADFRRARSIVLPAQFFVRHRRDFNMDVDPIERAAALARGIAIKPIGPRSLDALVGRASGGHEAVLLAQGWGRFIYGP